MLFIFGGAFIYEPSTGHLTTVPTDPFNGRAIGYDRNARLIWSVGMSLGTKRQFFTLRRPISGDIRLSIDSWDSNLYDCLTAATMPRM